MLDLVSHFITSFWHFIFFYFLKIGAINRETEIMQDDDKTMITNLETMNTKKVDLTFCYPFMCKHKKLCWCCFDLKKGPCYAKKSVCRAHCPPHSSTGPTIPWFSICFHIASVQHVLLWFMGVHWIAIMKFDFIFKIMSYLQKSKVLNN